MIQAYVIMFVSNVTKDIQDLQEKFCKAEQDCFGPRGQAEISLKIEDMRSSKTIMYMLYNAMMAFLVTM